MKLGSEKTLDELILKLIELNDLDLSGMVNKVNDLEKYQQYIEYQKRDEEANRIARQKSLVITNKNKYNYSGYNNGCNTHSLKWINPKPAYVINTLK